METARRWPTHTVIHGTSTVATTYLTQHCRALPIAPDPASDPASEPWKTRFGKELLARVSTRPISGRVAFSYLPVSQCPLCRAVLQEQDNTMLHPTAPPSDGDLHKARTRMACSVLPHSMELSASNENGSDAQDARNHHLSRNTDAMMPRHLSAQHGHASVPSDERGHSGPRKGWAVGGRAANLGRPAIVPPIRGISVGNMIDSGQPQRRQLICRHRLAPRSGLPSVRP